MFVCTCTQWYTCGGQRTTCWSWLSFHHVGLRDWIQGIRLLGGRHLYLLSHLSRPSLALHFMLALNLQWSSCSNSSVLELQVYATVLASLGWGGGWWAGSIWLHSSRLGYNLLPHECLGLQESATTILSFFECLSPRKIAHRETDLQNSKD